MLVLCSLNILNSLSIYQWFNVNASFRANWIWSHTCRACHCYSGILIDFTYFMSVPFLPCPVSVGRSEVSGCVRCWSSWLGFKLVFVFFSDMHARFVLLVDLIIKENLSRGERDSLDHLRSLFYFWDDGEFREAGVLRYKTVFSKLNPLYVHYFLLPYYVITLKFTLLWAYSIMTQLHYVPTPLWLST